MKIKHLSPNDYTKMAWKNGGGTTFEIAKQANSTDDFDWRVSMAVVASDGAFSEFAGKKRLLTILTGAGLDLKINHQNQILSGTDTLAFDGTDEIFAKVLGDFVQDFNLIYNPTLYQGTMVWAMAGQVLDLTGINFVMASVASEIIIDGHSFELNTYDCLQMIENQQIYVKNGQVCIIGILPI